MARHAHITEQLIHAQDVLRAVDGWTKEESPNRTRWVISVGGQVYYFSSSEVEAFLLGLNAPTRG